MARETLLDFFEDYFAQPDAFVVDDDGYRARTVTYRQVADAARRLAERLGQHGIGPNDHVVIWSENRAEWIAAFWGAVLQGVVVVPIDARASLETLRRIAELVRAKAVLIGDDVPELSGLPCPVWPLHDVLKSRADAAPEARDRAVPPRSRPTAGATRPLAEIIFTSGATAEPRGVTITHRNILANLEPIEREIAKYRRYERRFHPIRFLNLLPLSHMFGQSMATFVPPLIGGTVVFARATDPAAIVRQTRARRISVLVAVPKVLDVLREHIRRIAPETNEPDVLAGRHWWRRWWRYRRIHRLFGWKFWCMVVGAAPLDSESEAFWKKLGFVIVQGYGLTEAAPIVTLNHPFHPSAGTVGVPIPGVEVRVEPDGEILVRGENVTSGYYQADDGASSPGAIGVVDADGWLHTGDVGAIDGEGRLTIKGRKKEMIVTAQGLNVFPEDVERELVSEPGVTDAAVVGVRIGAEERIHAVLVLEPGVDPEAIVRAANARLGDHQRVWRALVWPGNELPRTEGTRKVRRVELREWIEKGPRVPGSQGPGVPGSDGSRVRDLVGRLTGGRAMTADTTLDELGLSSLDRVELSIALERACQTALDESAIATVKTIGDLEKLASTPSARAGVRSGRDLRFPRWNRLRISRIVRRLSLPTWILPLARVFMKVDARGLEHLRDLAGPVVFAVNHQSHMDVPAVLIALPARWRYRVAPSMSREFFDAHFDRRRYGWSAWFTNTLNYVLSCLFFNAFPFPRHETGARPTLRYIGEIAEGGDSILIFPEGQRTSTGAIAPFRPGVGLIASRLDLPVVPVRLDGLDKVLHRSMRFPKRGPVRVTFGRALILEGDDYPALARRVEAAVRAL